ncbi:glycogen debranching N-terminal domain-containing protein [Streptomyces radicis]|uniref:Amylo-alpha-1,6-glucosidase n=1 Tax=Streptomyces radicis TaxID=1750517 RepID=A0A3A9WDU9_9ACTN|nr:glycogen debranching N-terminal domain-containing protein [Streptomyces radicis]RKN05836.1 amylo-alpha-1,6-glucosidase [Streptomyces radicis]RKN17610.1 amylo-alpha-1,6-glucosidase [Streptomyces radicis]
MSVKSPDGSRPVESDAEPTAGLQPFLHDACVTLYAPSFAVSRPDGQLSRGADGFYHGDRRALSRLEVAVEGVELASVGGGVQGADHAVFRSVLRGVAEATPDPAVTLIRTRAIAPGRLTERLDVINSGALPAEVTLTVAAETDMAPMERVKSGGVSRPVFGEVALGTLAWSGPDLALRLTASPAPDAPTPAAPLRWTIALAPGERWSTELSCVAQESTPPLFPPVAPGGAPWRRPRLVSADRRFDRWVDQSHDDLERLLLADPERPSDLFVAAGAPWYATLFGRDALWAARMLLPLGTSLAAGTLRTLARRQGTSHDPETQEQPGKILHEVRHAQGDRQGPGFALPPRYFGTVDATPLWVCLLHDAWRWGLPPEEVEALLPHAEAALGWMRDHADADGDGFLEYVDTTGRGLANQGWKDSGDGIRFRDGSQAEAPIALCEVQAYAYEAAQGAAALLRAFERPGADRWEEWAEHLKSRFRERFWVEDAQGPYPAVALDGEKRPVDSVTSGFGHLLGTGLLDPEESALLARRLAGPDLDAGFGLRTLSAASGGFNPLGYHTGSIWPHDTAIAVHGLARAGFPDTAASLATGLIRASDSFGARLPELFAGYGADESRHPAPYPASCHPQAWAAASSVHVLRSLLGLEADAPGGTLTVAARLGHDLAPLRLTGLAVGGAPLSLAVRPDGTVDVEAPAGIAVHRARADAVRGT